MPNESSEVRALRMQIGGLERRIHTHLSEQQKWLATMTQQKEALERHLRTLTARPQPLGEADLQQPVHNVRDSDM